MKKIEEPVFKEVIAQKANQIVAVCEANGVPIDTEFASACGLIFGVTAKNCATEKEVFLTACADLYDNSHVYYKEPDSKES